jgi:GntR family transcriptional regulator / MocR family aminotransferase
MELHVSLSAGAPLGTAVYQQLRQAILDGRLRPGDGLPASRELARRLSVSRNTVTGAYQRLVAEGFLVGRIGAGTFVAPEGGFPTAARRAPAGDALRPRAMWRGVVGPALEQRRVIEPAYDFGIGVPDALLFPWDVWRRLVARQLRPPRARPARYTDPDELPALRAAIARHVGLARSVLAGPDDVIVTNGAQQAFDLIARVLLEPGARIAVEDPGYPPARLAFASHGARVVPVRVDGEGLDVAALPATARAVYVTPSHQFPLGTAMPLARRLALLEWAERHGAAIIEDDYDSEFRHDGRPLEPLQSLDRRGRVLYVGTFSKVMLPALRVGYIIAPSSLMPALRAARAVTDMHGPSAIHAALARFIDEGLLARHVRRVLRVYRDRRERLHAALARHMGGALAPLPSSAGLHVAAFFGDRRVDTSALASAALAAGVAVEPLRPYYQKAPRAGLALGFGAIPAAKIDEGIRRLAHCFRSLRHRQE